MHFLWTRHNAGIDITEECLKEYIYSFKGTQVTDFLMNVNGTVSTADSRVLETFADKYLATEENGISVDYKDSFAREAYSLIHEKKLDMYKVWIDAAKEIGINPWLSFRMNDCHGNMTRASVRKSSYVDKYPEYHIAAHRDRVGYFDKCLDYGREAVRQMMIDYVDEMLDRYDVYGIELDMMRELFFVRFGCEYEAQAVVRELVKGIIATVEKHEKRYGHRIKRSVLLSSEPNLLIERGVDVTDLAEDFDSIVIIPRWETFDSDMPIELWKQLLRDTNLKLGCGQQLLYKPYRDYKPVITSVKMAFGQAMANLSRGSDFVYLYNYMDFGRYEGEIGEWLYDESIRNDRNRPWLFGNIGKIETLMKQPRSHMVTYSDYCRYNDNVCPALPIEYPTRDGAYKQIKIPVGRVPENASVRLILGIASEEEIPPCDITVYVNSTPSEFERVTRINGHIYEGRCYAYTVAGKMYDIMYAEVKIMKKCRLEHVEIEVVPKPCEL